MKRMVAPTAAAPDIATIAADPRVVRACALLRETDAETLADMRAIVRIAAPSLDERERALWVRDRLAASGLDAVELDDVGNVLGVLPGDRHGHPPVVLAAHLDTVFDRATALSVRELNGRIAAPGIADNARGLAGLIALARVLRRAGPPLDRPVVFAATVGEEGIGDLRGVKHLFRPGHGLHAAAAFIALDGTGMGRVVHRAVGSRRLRVAVNGPGGHSWADRGMPNPIHVVAEGVARLAQAAPSREQSTALAVGRIGGGTSVNAIPEAAWFEVDLRAENRADLEALEAQTRELLAAVVAAANAARRAGTGALTLSFTLIGDRPSGATPVGCVLVRAALAASRHVGERAELVASSTDANVPIALGIPAIALGAGGDSGRTHTTDEWYSNTRGPAGLERVLLTLLAVARAGRLDAPRQARTSE
jgi:acetylornithine deacetylase/succinyl-diaminopimelate desuccinylase-like protein